MADELTPDPDAEVDDAAIAAEVDEITKSPVEQQADKVKNALIASKRQGRELARRIKELEPVAARAGEIDGKLSAAQPIIDAVLNNPKLRAEALRIAGGGAPSRSTTEQPLDDADAVSYAEDSGYYLADGQTPDAARARRVLDRQVKAMRQVAEDVVRPFAGVTLSEKSERNIEAAIRQTDADGTPYATEESIRQVAADLGPQAAHLLSNPQVMELILDRAAGIDRRKGRTPKAQAEPLYLESPGGRGRREPAVDSGMKDILARHGVSEKDFNESGDKLGSITGTRRSIALGK